MEFSELRHLAGLRAKHAEEIEKDAGRRFEEIDEQCNKEIMALEDEIKAVKEERNSKNAKVYITLMKEELIKGQIKTLLNQGHLLSPEARLDIQRTIFKNSFEIIDFERPIFKDKRYYEFNNIRGVATDSEGNIFVRSAGENFFSRVSRAEREVQFLKMRDAGPDWCLFPCGIAIDDYDNVFYCSDTLTKFGKDGTTEAMKISTVRLGGVCCDNEEGTVMLMTNCPNVICVFNKNLELIREVECGKINYWGIAINSIKEILVTSPGKNRVDVIDKYGKLKKTLIGGEGVLKRPHHICVDALDNIYVVSDSEGFPLKIFDRHGVLMKSIATPPGGMFSGVSFCEKNGTLTVSDIKNNTIYVYGPR